MRTKSPMNTVGKPVTMKVNGVPIRIGVERVKIPGCPARKQIYLWIGKNGFSVKSKDGIMPIHQKYCDFYAKWLRKAFRELNKKRTT